MPKVTVDGIVFDSPLESKHYLYLKEHPNIEILELQKTFHMMDGFHYFDIEKGKMRKTRNMHYTPDFIIKCKGVDKPIAFETKGFARKDYMIRKKIFLSLFRDEYYHVQVHSMKQCKAIFDKYRSD